jgi:hypothetical protein
LDNTPLTLGLEFESVISSLPDMMRKFQTETRKNPLIKSVTRDASVESNLGMVGSHSRIFLGSQLLASRYMNRGGSVTSGYEIVTQPLEMPVMRRVIRDILNTQVKMGEIFSDRSSIHVHIGFPCGLIFLKTATALGLKTEPLFYKIAGMGNPFRGEANHSNYCRPLALPPVVRLSDSDKLAVLNPEKSLDADGVEDFWGTFGGIRHGDHERYNPLRYYGINIFSTVLRGTMEYRFFNFCTNVRFVNSVASLAQFISDLMIRFPLSTIEDLPKVSIFEKNPTVIYHKLLDCLLYMGDCYRSEYPINSKDIDSLRELIDTTSQPVFKKELVLTHIRNGRIQMNDAKRFGLELVNTAIESGHVDIHNFTMLDRKLIGD